MKTLKEVLKNNMKEFDFIQSLDNEDLEKFSDAGLGMLMITLHSCMMKVYTITTERYRNIKNLYEKNLSER